ncbi:hypothetical protein ScPMuIL_017811 [Solemya velum]
MEASASSNVHDVLSVRGFLTQFGETTLSDFQINSKDEELQAFSKYMDIPVEDVAELANVCSPETLKCGHEPIDRYTLLTRVPDDIELTSVRLQKREAERRKDTVYRNFAQRKMKYKNFDGRLLPEANVDNQIPDEVRVTYPDVILLVYVHKPYYHTQGVTRQILKIDHGFLVLGSQKLSDLRDRIRCVNDLAVPGDHSENPDSPVQYYAKDIFKSGFFFIEDTFYNDFREPDSVDYSHCIREWAKDPARKLGPYQNKVMEETSFVDLNIKLGHPYVYQHQGDCEHLIVFSDLRLLDRDDCQDVREYPKLIKRMLRRRTECRSCLTHSARWLVYNSEMAPENPCYFCDPCFKALHYDKNMAKIGTFEAFKYFDSHAIV